MATNGEVERRAHWEGVYGTKAPTEVSWFQARPDISLELIRSTGIPLNGTIVDVGGGASTLVDHLLHEGRSSILVLDISATALARAQKRLGSKAQHVGWIAGDVTQWRPDAQVDLWHDRAVLHFLTETSDQNAYADTLRTVLKPGGCAIIAGFAPGGPLKCSGLDIVQHDAQSLQHLLGDDFHLVRIRNEVHRAPWGSEQAFRYHVFRRV